MSGTPSRVPSRSRSSYAQASFSQPTFSSRLSSRASIGDLRGDARDLRPPSRSYNGRSSSAMGNRSRPSTPSFVKQDPYTGSIRVSIRPNPFTVDHHHGSQWYIDESRNTIINNQDSTEFTFDNVFQPDPLLSNKYVYEKTCYPLIQKFLDEGYNSTVFAYGMTGSGKTFSMRGVYEDPGFVKLAVDDVFDKIENDMGEKQYTISMTYLEIYNERIIDLLNSGPPISSDLKIRDDPILGTKIMGITTPIIKNRNQILQYIERGDTNRKTSETDFNARSSRSHAILQIKLNTLDVSTGIETNSTLSLCDLAGSEKATSSAERRKEGSFINKSLLALSTVINKLSISSNTGNLTDHIPYRDSKLTRLLQPALSGSSLVLILCTIHMGAMGINSKFADNQFVSETYNTLRFAARAKDIVINVQKSKLSLIGEGDQMKLVEELRRTIESQRNEIAILKNSPGASAMPSVFQENLDVDPRLAAVESENRLLNEKVEHLIRLTDLQKTETIILKNDTLNDLLGSNVDNNLSQMMIGNLEEFYKRVNYEMDEYRAYIQQLEHQLKIAHQESLLKGSFKLAHGLNERQMEALLKDQEEEIIQLKEVIKDKDHFIKSLNKTSKLRRLVESDSVNTPERKRYSLDKENGDGEYKLYTIGKVNGESTNFVI